MNLRAVDVNGMGDQSNVQQGVGEPRDKKLQEVRGRKCVFWFVITYTQTTRTYNRGDETAQCSNNTWHYFSFCLTCITYSPVQPPTLHQELTSEKQNAVRYINLILQNSDLA